MVVSVKMGADRQSRCVHCFVHLHSESEIIICLPWFVSQHCIMPSSVFVMHNLHPGSVNMFPLFVQWRHDFLLHHPHIFHLTHDYRCTDQPAVTADRPVSDSGPVTFTHMLLVPSIGLSGWNESKKLPIYLKRAPFFGKVILQKWDIGLHVKPM